MPLCPKCQHDKSVKNGIHHERQRYRCKQCGFQFTRSTPRGRPAQEKAMAVLLYTMGVSLNTIARLLKVSTSAVLRWVRLFVEKTYEKPEPREAVIVELDEMWHFLGSKKQTLDLESVLSRYRSNSLTGNVGLVIKPHLQS